MPITILSRCQKYEFFRISDDLITKHLQEICETEKIKFDVEGLKEITELADGGMRDALSMLDQLSKEKTKITLDLVVQELGSVSLVKIKKLIDYLDENKVSETIQILNELKKTNLNYKIVVKKIIEILSQKAVTIVENGNYQNLDYHKIKKIILELNDMLNKINLNVNPYIIIEMILLEALEKDNNNINDNAKIFEKIKEKTEEPEKENVLKKTIEEKKPIDLVEETNPVKDTYEDLKKIRLNNCFAVANKTELIAVKEKWEEFKSKVSNQLKGLILDTIPVAASSDYVIIVTNILHQDNEINNELTSIEEEYQKLLKESKKLVALSNDEWLQEKEKYILNIKNGYKYTVQEETKEPNVDSNIEELATNLFDSSKLEIK